MDLAPTENSRKLKLPADETAVRMPISARIEGFRSSFAALIGIDRYVDGVPALRTPVADATKLAGILRRYHGFKVQVACDENATLEKLRALLSDLRTRVGKDDRVLFYFAGHGIALEGDEGPRGFLLPQDAARDSTDRYLPMVELYEALSTLPCRHMLVILDCCFAGAFRWSSTRDLALAPESLHRERYAWYIQDAAWQAIASAAHDQKALDVAVGEALGERGQTAGHSPFAKALIEGLAGAADRRRANGTGDGVITATELLLHLDEQLTPPPGSSRRRQTPILWPLPKHDKGQFVFLVPGKELDLPPAPPLNPDANPWRGLKPYESTHADLFFGRRRASERLLEQVLRDPLVVVTGPSGIGKSSLVRAGLLPLLPTKIHPIVVRPGPAPFASLAAALASESPSGCSPDAETLRNDSKTLAAWVKDQHSAERDLLLVIDQAEELVTMNRDEEVLLQYLALFGSALNADNRLRLVVTVRSEFEPQFAQSPLNDRWVGARHLVPQMTQDELRRVIEGPAAVKVMRFETADLVDTLVNEVVQMPGALPLLSFALSEMYANYHRRHADDRTLTNKDYDALQGGVAGSLRVRANRLIDDLDKAHQPTAHRVLERLVSIESGEFARRRVPRRELDAADPDENKRIEEILVRLDDARLIVSDEVDNQPYLELAHDALILGWDRLLAWVRVDLERIVALRRLTPDAEEWTSTKNAGFLWDDAARVAIVKQLQSAAAPGLNAVEHQFANASLRRSKRNQTVWWSTAAALLAFLGAAIFASYLFFRERNEARAQTSIAEDRRKEAEARGNDLQLANERISTNLADSLVSGGDRKGAIKALLAAIPANGATMSDSWDSALYRALWGKWQQFHISAAHFQKIDHARFYGEVLLVSSSEGQTIALLDAATGAVRQHFLTHPGRVLASAMSRDGMKVAVISDMFGSTSAMEFFVKSNHASSEMATDLPNYEPSLDGNIRLWYNSDDLIKSIAMPDGSKYYWEGKANWKKEDPVGSVLAVSDDQYSLIMANGSDVFYVDDETAQKYRLPGSDKASHFAISPDGMRALEIERYGVRMKIWSLGDKPALVGVEQLETPLLGAGAIAEAWSPTSDRYAVADRTKITIFCFPSGMLCQEINLEASTIAALAFHQGSERLRVLHQTSGRLGLAISDIRLNDIGRMSSIPNLQDVFLTNNGDRIVAYTSPSVTYDQLGEVSSVPGSSSLDVIAGSLRNRFPQQDDIRLLVPVDDGRVVTLSGYRPTQVRLLELSGERAKASFELSGSPEELIPSLPSGLFVFRDDQLLQYALDGKELGSWSVRSPIAVSPDKRYLSWTTNDLHVVFALDAARIVASFPVSQNSELRLLPYSKVALVRGGSWTLADISNTLPERIVTGLDNVEQATIDSNFRYLVTTSGPSISVYDLEKEKPVSGEYKHGASVDVGIRDYIVKVQFLRDSPFFISGGADGKVKLWSVGGGFVADLVSLENGIYKLELLDQAEPIVMARSQGADVATVKLLPVDPAARLQQARQVAAE